MTKCSERAGINRWTSLVTENESASTLIQQRNEIWVMFICCINGSSYQGLESEESSDLLVSLYVSLVCKTCKSIKIHVCKHISSGASQIETLFM